MLLESSAKTAYPLLSLRATQARGLSLEELASTTEVLHDNKVPVRRSEALVRMPTLWKEIPDL